MNIIHFLTVYDKQFESFSPQISYRFERELIRCVDTDLRDIQVDLQKNASGELCLSLTCIGSTSSYSYYGDNYRDGE